MDIDQSIRYALREEEEEEEEEGEEEEEEEDLGEDQEMEFEEDFEDFVGNSRSQSQARQQAGLTVKQSKPEIYYVVYRLKFQQVPSEGSMKSKRVKQYQIVSLYFNT